MPETIGQQLKAAREARSLTFGKVTQATHIQARLIEAMEADDFESLPSPVQARAFLRLYAGFLGLSLDDMIARQRLAADEPPAAYLDIGAVPGQGQMPVEVSVNPGATEPVGEPQADKSLRLQARIKRLLLRIRQNLPQPRATSLPDEPARPITPANPEPVANTQRESSESQVEEPGSDWQGKPLTSDSLSSEHRESQFIFTSIGEALRQRREALSLTLDEIENHTHVRKHYLQALEFGDFDHLPSSVQTRGMLNNYAHFLDMDVDAILMQFAEGLQTQRLERRPTPVEKPRNANAKLPSKVNLPPGLRRYLSMDILVGGGLILILLVFAIWGTSRVIGLRSATTPQPTAQSISDILVATSGAGTLTQTPTAVGTEAFIPTAGVTVIGTIPPSGPGSVQVVIVALEQAFLRVTVDGKIQFDGRITDGTAYSFSGNNQIEVLTGNGAAISILFNQSDLGPLGRFGEVVDRIFTANAILNPTATTTPTPTISPKPTITPRVSPTPSQTHTPFIPQTTQ
jgi:cytoskeletal protein RodZ